MGLISNKAIVIVSSHSPYYLSLGYDVPRHKINNKNSSTKDGYAFDLGAKFEVDVKDLFPTSTAIVEVECDRCKERKQMKYVALNSTRAYKEDKKYYCKKCANRVFNTGSNNHNWNSTKTEEERVLARGYREYYSFKRSVLMRDGFKCICCEKTKKLFVHHLDGYDNYPEKRLEVSNGVTLCDNCHKNFHLLYGRGNNTKEQFEEWFGSVKDFVTKDFNNLEETKKVYCFETDSVYASVNETILKLGLHSKDKKEILECCNLRGNTVSVRGFHFLWQEKAITMTSKEIEMYVLNTLRNHRHVPFIDLETGIVYLSAKECSDNNSIDIARRLTAIKYTINNIEKRKLRYIPYDTFLEMDKNVRKEIFKSNEITVFRKYGGKVV